jgi:Ribonuclease D
MTIHLHHNDIPTDLSLGNMLAIDTEAMGLRNGRDRLCVLQMSDGQGDAHLVRFAPGQYEAPNLRKLLADESRLKLLHYARFDMAIIKRHLGIMLTPVYCTKIASKIARTYTDRHGLKELAREIAGVEISKQQQSSDWGQEGIDRSSDELCRQRCPIPAQDTRKGLRSMLAREGRSHLLEPCLAFLPHRVMLDLGRLGG